MSKQPNARTFFICSPRGIPCLSSSGMGWHLLYGLGSEPISAVFLFPSRSLNAALSRISSSQHTTGSSSHPVSLLLFCPSAHHTPKFSQNPQQARHARVEPACLHSEQSLGCRD